MSEAAAQFVNIEDIKPHPDNPRFNDNAVEEVAGSIKRFGFASPIIVRLEDGVIIAGHTRYKAALSLGLSRVPVRYMDLDPVDAKLLMLADNKIGERADWDEDLLQELFEELKDEDLTGLGWDEDELDGILDDLYSQEEEEHKNKMSDDFIVPPFSVLDTRQGYWRERARKWKSIIKDNGESREGLLLSDNSSKKLASYNKATQMKTVSILDPVLAEIICEWFGMGKNTTAFDPFAGDTVFGFVAGTKGIKFTGTELRKEQVDLNNERTEHLGCQYICDDALNVDKHIQDDSVDLVFSCPPYADLEKYSDDERDISNMSHEDFFSVYCTVLRKMYNKLKNDRFCVIVIGEVRGKDQGYISLVPKTIETMKLSGFLYYNEIILINNAGTLPFRAGKMMRTSRKVGKQHQNVLVFYKGDPKNIKNKFPDIEVDTSDEFNKLQGVEYS